MEKNDHTAKLNKTTVMLGIIVVADDDPAKVVQPGNPLFHLPLAFVPPQWPPILGLRPLAIPTMQCDAFDALDRQLLVQWTQS